MTQVADVGRWESLARLLVRSRQVHEQLAEAIQSRLAAMRRADVAALADFAVREQNLVRQLQELEGTRRSLVVRMAEELDLPGRGVRAPTVSQIAARLPEPSRSRLLREADSLKLAALRAARNNRLAGVVSREVLGHLHGVLGSIRPPEEGPFAYAGDGARVAPSPPRIFEAVG
jgi:hypothetical protein